MNLLLRASLAVFSLLVLIVVMRRIKKAKLEIADSIFWFGLALVLIVVAAFPEIAFSGAKLLGFDAASNFVFFCGIVVLLARSFTQDQKITELKKKLTALTQYEALNDAKHHTKE